ncbi:hypothetical protein J0X20_14280 [Streptomyces sp. KCTC 0041BP]|uniref:hypothetical protein n=1 Tax=Streptomyces sp. KCTC 0041BP TaxID=201500 RepID=UPI001AE4148D|nr:hypothetical protein [Streptomyces sp. KCTC 0041BP]MBP0934766.1 hypothetical protein [Streptomyces sp. KCTC 0041BP]
MTYNLLTVDPVGPEIVALALAGCLGIAVGDVDVADSDGDPDLRNWDAPVSCEYRAVQGDVAWSLDVYAQEHVADQPPESDLAAGFAKAAMTTVLFPAEEAPPSAYWAVTPEGVLTRARLELSDDEPPLYAITAVEAPVPQLPGATVTRFAEIVREQRPDTPVAWAFAASVEKVRQAASGLARLSLDDGTGSPVWTAKGNLVAWERGITQMESGWAPSGWYPAGLYRERLESRDELAGIGAHLPRDVTELLDEALEQLDRRFAAATEDDPAGSLRRELTGSSAEQTPVGWWWHRRPNPAPWEQACPLPGSVVKSKEINR